MAGKVKIIPATKDRFASKPITAARKRRVAAYARVSTDEDEQLNSYAAQVSHYEEYIRRNPDWEFAGIYSDEGISGTHIQQRTGFRQMLDDALVQGKIDLILTKSVSRFARNTVDTLTSIRELKAKGVEVYFEKENIWTFDSKGEMLLTIMSSIAQEESRSISENVLWSIRKKFENGEYWVSYTRMLGYEKGEDGSMVINEEEAETVRYIFNAFLEGQSPSSIASELTEKGIRTVTGKEEWAPSTIWHILSNEKYVGDAVMQKTYKTDLLGKRRINNGEVRKYYVRDAHEAIISREQFEMVQLEIEERRKVSAKRSSKYLFSGKLFCGDCGAVMGSKVWHSTDKYRCVVWQCNDKFTKGCTTPHLKDVQIKDIFLRAANQLVTDKDEVLAEMEGIRDNLNDTSALEEKLESAEREFAEVNALVDHYGKTVSVKENVFTELQLRYRRAADKVKKCNDEISNMKRKARITEYFIEQLKTADGVFTSFTDEMFRGLCDRMTVIEKGLVRVRFRNGAEIDVSY